MATLLLMFQSSFGQTGGVQEDAIMTVGVLVEGGCGFRIEWVWSQLKCV